MIDMDKETMRLAGLTDKEIHLLCTPFVNLAQSDRANAFHASDKLAAWNRRQPFLADCSAASRMTDKLFNEKNIQSPADGKYYSNRQQWNEMLKRNNCMEFGNDQKAKPRPVQMKNMNLKPAIADAMKKHGVL